MAEPTVKKNEQPANLPGMGVARQAADVLGQLFVSNIDSCNELWTDLRKGEISLKSLLSHYAGSVQRTYEDIEQLIRAPFVDTDRPDWAIFWYDLGVTNRNRVQRLPLARRYPSTLELHQTELQMLGQDHKIDNSYYHATLEPDGRTLTVQLDKLPDNSRKGDYVGLVTAQSLAAPLAVVMVTVGRAPAKEAGGAKPKKKEERKPAAKPKKKKKRAARAKK